MSHHNIVLSQLLRLMPRHEFDRLAREHDGNRRQGSMNRWTQFVALSVGQLGGRNSLRDIESSLAAQPRHRYHLGSQTVSRSALGRANERLDFCFYEALFARLYQCASRQAPRHGFALPEKLFSLDASLIDVSMKLFPQANYNRMKAAFKLTPGAGSRWLDSGSRCHHVRQDRRDRSGSFIAIPAGEYCFSTRDIAPMTGMPT